MSKDTKNHSENTQEEESVRWETAPISLDKLRITAGHESAANELVQIIQRALKVN